ncbi:MAG TPA: GAF domain-containing protein [Anaerolineales bacterium]
MDASSKATGSLRDALQLTSAAWVALADREGGKWSLIGCQGLSRSAQPNLLDVLNEPTVDSWLCNALNGGNSQSASLPSGSGLDAKRLYAYPVPDSSRMVVVGVDEPGPKDQRVWRLVAALFHEEARPSQEQAPLPDLLSDLPYDLTGSLTRVLKAFVEAAPCMSAWLGIRRGEGLDVLAEWNDPKAQGLSFTIDANELLKRVQRTLREVAAAQGDAEWEAIPTWGKRRGATVWALMPLVIGQRLIGAVAMWRTNPMSHDEWELLRDLAQRIAPSVEMAATFSEMSTHLARLGMLNDFVLTVSSAQNLDQIARRVFDLLARAFGTEKVSLMLLSTDSRMLREFRTREKKVISSTSTVEGHPVASFLRKARLVRADDVASSGLTFLSEETRSALVVPLKYRGQVTGLLTIENPRPEAFSQYDEHLMVVIASHLAGLVEYGRLREEAEGRARSLGLIHEVVQQVIGLTDKKEMAQITADLLGDYFGYEMAAVLFEDGDERPVAQGFGGRQGGALDQIRVTSQLDTRVGIVGQVFATGQSILINDTQAEPLYKPLHGWQASSELCVPIRENERTFGIINIESSQANAFTANDLIAIESLAGILSAVVASADQYQHLQDMVRQLRQTQTELKARMDAQQAAENRLLQAAKLAAVGEMAAGIAHELNNPLTTVTGFTELVLDEMPEDAEHRAELEMVHREARRATDVVRRLLDFSRQGERTRARADINAIVEDVVALTQHLIHTSGVQLTLNLGAELPWASVDRNQLKQVLLNLIHNALQAMPDGGSLLLGTATRTRDDRSWLTMFVRDTGIGMAAPDRERVFEPFFTTKGDRGGTGLGLSVSYGIVTDHGGVIDVESEPGTGSTFTVWIPL